MQITAMDPLLATAAGLTFLLGTAHSVLGERYIIRRVLRRDQPHLFGSDAFTKRTLRFAWHIMTLLAWALAALMLADPTDPMLWIMATTFAAAALLTLVVSRAQHLSWVVEVAIVALLLFAL